MSIVEIDERGRMTIPRKMGLRKTRATVITAGSFFVTIPISKSPERDVANWLTTTKGHRELKAEADEVAREDSVEWQKGDDSYNENQNT